MAIALNHWSSMDLKKLQMFLTDLGENQISMFSDFCHVVKNIIYLAAADLYQAPGIFRLILQVQFSCYNVNIFLRYCSFFYLQYLSATYTTTGMVCASMPVVSDYILLKTALPTGQTCGSAHRGMYLRLLHTYLYQNRKCPP